MFKQETISDIETVEHERRKKAARYEFLIGPIKTLRTEVTMLQSQEAGLTALRKISDLIPQIPRAIHTRSNTSIAMTIPSGVEAREFLRLGVSACFAGAQSYEDRRQRQLKAVRQQLHDYETSLVTEFGQEALDQLDQTAAK
jgi:hypothetical protein